MGQCQAAKVPVFVKQLGAHIIDRNDAGFDAETEQVLDERMGQWVVSDRGAWPTPVVRVRLSDRKGGDPSEWPHDLRVREFPDRQLTVTP